MPTTLTPVEPLPGMDTPVVPAGAAPRTRTGHAGVGGAGGAGVGAGFARPGTNGGTVRTGTHPGKPSSRIARNARFLREFVKAPGVVAAVAPSSRFLAREMIRGVDVGACRTIVEYGPGSGVFTEEVERVLPAGWHEHDLAHPGRHDGKLIAIELNRPIAEMFHARHPEVRLHCDSAANVLDIIRQEGVEPGEVDLVVSGLGWPSFSDHLRTSILDATFEALRPGGEFRTFGYHCGLLMRGAWHFRGEIKRLFSRVSISPVIWRNAPPAFVYRCIK